ncbi:MAG: sulfotransferase family protein [Planctomycetes bacterium]|nr:sulfotransferase family protein [Planctomycetota bacterium]
MFPFVSIVSGLPRSGTSMVMQMVNAGGMPAVVDGQRTADEDNPRGYFEFERVKALRTDKAWLDNAVGKVVKVVHILLQELPDDRDYRVLFLERNLDEVVESQRKMLVRLGKPGAGLPPDRMKAAFLAQLRGVDSMLAARPRVRVLRLQHQNVVMAPATAAAAINAFLGGGLDELAMVAAVDQTLYRNRR